MIYVSVQFTVAPRDPYTEILLSELAEIGYDSFEETDEGLHAYIIIEKYHQQDLLGMSVLNLPEVDVVFEVSELEDKNWNAIWESDFEPIEVGAECRVRAPFHPDNNCKYEIVISPKMSFGTGHHQTTWLMMKQMLTADWAGKEVLDLGTGTGVLAILAAKMGAKNVVAIDVDEWAYENAVENVELNKTVNIDVEKGGVSQIKDRKFQTILANINKNVLLQEMPTLVESLHDGGSLLLSGFFENDIEDIKTKSEKCGLTYSHVLTKENWAMLELQKV